MEGLPIDMSHPAVRDYLSLVRLQVLTPLSLLINIATVVVCSTVVDPSIGGVSKLYPASISPKSAIIALYVAAIYVGQIGYCVLLVLAGKPETKRALTKGVGLTLVFANWVMAAWAIAFVFQWFLLATILQGLLVLLLVYSNMSLLIYHPPTSSRPFDTALIHAPMRFFLILPLSLLFPYCIFITLGLTYPPGPTTDYALNPWSGFGVVLGTNLLGLAVIIIRRDIVWCIAAVWIAVSIWVARPKPMPVYATVILFTVLHPLALLGSFIYSRFYHNRRIALPPDHENVHDEEFRDEDEVGPQAQRGPGEIDVDALWG